MMLSEFEKHGGGSLNHKWTILLLNKGTNPDNNLNSRDASLQISNLFYRCFNHFHFSGLRRLLEPMLAGIFEINEHAVWTFEHYFKTVNSIVSMKTLDVFYAQNGTNMKLYLSKTDW